jgi:hypothetical protein
MATEVAPWQWQGVGRFVSVSNCQDDRYTQAYRQDLVANAGNLFSNASGSRFEFQASTWEVRVMIDEKLSGL